MHSLTDFYPTSLDSHSYGLLVALLSFASQSWLALHQTTRPLSLFLPTSSTKQAGQMALPGCLAFFKEDLALLVMMLWRIW